jgi:AmpE protein
MTFLAIIIAVLLLQVWGTATRVHYDGWFSGWQARVAAWGMAGGVSLALLVLLPTVLAQFILDRLDAVLFGLLWLPLAVLVLLYSFGRGDFPAAMARYREHVRNGDFEAAYLAAGEHFGWDDSSEAPDDEPTAHALIQRAFLYEGLQRWFAVLLYFVLLGPAGALLYRLLQLCRQSFEPAVVERWLFLLDWLPARLLAATFTLTGDFLGSRDELLAALRDHRAPADTLLFSVGSAALGPDRGHQGDDPEAFAATAVAQNSAFEGLLLRSAVCWSVVLSLLVLLF